MSESLTPTERDEVQASFIRSWLGRKRRAAFAARPVARRYDISGRLIENDGSRRLTTFAEDRRK